MNEVYDHIVIGTGPAALSCCASLIANHRKPLVLDIGSKAEDSLSEILKSDERKISKNYKNNYMYSSFQNAFQNTFMLESVGFGGFSNVWGGAIMRPTDDDLADWPIDLSDLEEYFNETEKFFLQRGALDKLSNSRNMSPPDICSRKPKHDSANFGTPRIAYSTKNSERIFACDEIFEGWIQEGLITYYPKSKVETLTLNNELITVKTSQGKEYIARKVYLAAGAAQSTIIIANSLNKDSLEINLHENKVILSAWLTTIKSSTLDTPQLTITSKDCSFYAQIYRFRFSFLRRVLNFKPIVNFYVSLLGSFLTLSMLFLPEEMSGYIKIKKLSLNNFSVEEINPVNSKYIRKNFKSEFKKNISPSLYLGSLIKNYGYGYHVGSSFPMKRFPSGSETNIDGELKLFPNVHIIDGSVLTTLPAIPLTYLIMANAMRITEKSLAR